MKSEVFNKFPYSETDYLWLTYEGEGGQTWYITSDAYRRSYSLWKGQTRTNHSSGNPMDLYEYMK